MRLLLGLCLTVGLSVASGCAATPSGHGSGWFGSTPERIQGQDSMVRPNDDIPMAHEVGLAVRRA